MVSIAWPARSGRAGLSRSNNAQRSRSGNCGERRLAG